MLRLLLLWLLLLLLHRERVVRRARLLRDNVPTCCISISKNGVSYPRTEKNEGWHIPQCANIAESILPIIAIRKQGC